MLLTNHLLFIDFHQLSYLIHWPHQPLTICNSITAIYYSVISIYASQSNLSVEKLRYLIIKFYVKRTSLTPRDNLLQLQA